MATDGSGGDMISTRNEWHFCVYTLGQLKGQLKSTIVFFFQCGSINMDGLQRKEATFQIKAAQMPHLSSGQRESNLPFSWFSLTPSSVEITKGSSAQPAVFTIDCIFHKCTLVCWQLNRLRGKHQSYATDWRISATCRNGPWGPRAFDPLGWLTVCLFVCQGNGFCLLLFLVASSNWIMVARVRRLCYSAQADRFHPARRAHLQSADLPGASRGRRGDDITAKGQTFQGWTE